MHIKNTFTKIFTDERLPFIELRYSNSNAHYKKHFHDTFSLGVNKKGLSIYTNKDSSYTLDKNMISIINPKAVHSCNSCSEDLNEYYMIYLDNTWCEDIQKIINKDIKTFINISVDILEDKKLYKEFINLCEYLFENNHILDKENILYEFFIKFFSLFLDENKDNIVDKSFEDILIFFEKNFKENISIEELSKEFSLNPFYIIRLFKLQTNMTPHAFLLNLKINKAKEMLKKNHSIVDVALECGFFDQSHFHKNFLKIVACTPNEYKLNFVQ